MKQRQTLNLLATILGAVTMGYALMGCNGNANSLPRIADGVALFDNFIYQGDDDYYNRYPLPDSSSFYTPILPGWYSDPSICTNNKGDYFLVTSTFAYFPGVPIFHSRDLVNWRLVGHVLNRESQLVNMHGQEISGGIFAPAISYNPYNGYYYMVTTNVGVGNFYVKTQDPFDNNWSDPIRLPEVGGIDPSFFFDEDGKAYIVNNDVAPDNKPEYDGHRTIRIQEFDWRADKTVGPRKILVNKGVNPSDKPIWIEGPHMYKINGKYYLMAAEGGTAEQHSEVIFRSDSPMGGFKAWGNNPILTQRHLDANRPNPITCAGHADLIQTDGSDWWAVFLACRPIDNAFENLGRETFLMPVKWSEDGFPYMTKGDEVIPMIQRREGVLRDSCVTFGNFTDVEEFDDELLGLQWLTLRAPATQLYSLSDTPGYLALKGNDTKVSEKGTPAYVCRRMQHHKFVASTRMLFNPTTEKEAAGMLLFKNETHHYFFNVCQKAGKRCVSLLKISPKGEETLAACEVDTEQKCFNLKVVSKGSCYDFHYSIDGGDEWIVLCRDIDARHLSTATAGGFTGSTIGIYAVKE